MGTSRTIFSHKIFIISTLRHFDGYVAVGIDAARMNPTELEIGNSAFVAVGGGGVFTAHQLTAAETATARAAFGRSVYSRSFHCHKQSFVVAARNGVLVFAHNHREVVRRFLFDLSVLDAVGRSVNVFDAEIEGCKFFFDEFVHAVRAAHKESERFVDILFHEVGRHKSFFATFRVAFFDNVNDFTFCESSAE